MSRLNLFTRKGGDLRIVSWDNAAGKSWSLNVCLLKGRSIITGIDYWLWPWFLAEDGLVLVGTGSAFVWHAHKWACGWQWDLSILSRFSLSWQSAAQQAEQQGPAE